MAFAAFLSWNPISAQTTVLQENFTTYAGTAATVPAGWTFSYNGNYTTTQSSGLSGPNSYKFGVNNATITSPQFSGADSLSFWVKGNSTDTISKLVVMESADNITYDTIVVLKPLPTNATGQTYVYPVQSTSQYIQIAYNKSLGNVAFDDFLLTSVPPITSQFTNMNVCDGSPMQFTDMSTSSNGTITSWMWTFGEPASGPADTSMLQNPMHTYMGPGSYTVQLIVTNSNSDTDTSSMIVTVYPNPVASFTFTSAGSAVSFMDASTGGSGSFSYMWDFGDNNTSTLTNPVHTYIADGNYTTCLTITDIYGCADTVCQVVNVTTVGGVSQVQLKDALTIYPNPSPSGIITLSFGKYSAKSMKIKVYNIIGNIVLERDVNASSIEKQTIDLSQQPAGNYFVNITAAGETITRRITIK